MCNRSSTSPIRVLVCALTLSTGAGHSVAGSAAAPRIAGSAIDIYSVGVGISSTGIQGSKSSKRGAFGKRKNSSTPDIPASVDVGVLDFACGGVLVNSKVRINAVATGVVANGAKVRIGTLATTCL